MLTSHHPTTINKSKYQTNIPKLWVLLIPVLGGSTVYMNTNIEPIFASYLIPFLGKSTASININIKLTFSIYECYSSLYWEWEYGLYKHQYWTNQYSLAVRTADYRWVWMAGCTLLTSLPGKWSWAHLSTIYEWFIFRTSGQSVTFWDLITSSK